MNLFGYWRKKKPQPVAYRDVFTFGMNGSPFTPEQRLLVKRGSDGSAIITVQGYGVGRDDYPLGTTADFVSIGVPPEQVAALVSALS